MKRACRRRFEDAWENAKGHQRPGRAGTSVDEIKVETENPIHAYIVIAQPDQAD